MMSGSKAPDFDTYELFRATHSHNSLSPTYEQAHVGLDLLTLVSSYYRKEEFMNINSILDNVGKVIVGKDDVVVKVLTSILAGGHILLEDVPGTGKTMLAKTIAKSIDCEFKRIQFTPDLLPSDITGLHIYNQKSGEFVLSKGPVFANIILADEINRATPRKVNALSQGLYGENAHLYS